MDQPPVEVHHGDCLDVLRQFADASVDAIVTDPPYGLSDLRPALVTAAIAAWLAGDREHVPDAKGFMGRSWDAFVPPPAVWDECLRVLKPGGHLIAFAGSRTGDLMGLSVRLAGFEIRDTITWHYASGFPKSLDVSKAIDRAAGAVRDVVGTGSAGASSLQRVSRVEQGYRSALTEVTPEAYPITAPATDAAHQWAGWGTALKPASEPIIVARKPLTGTVAATVLEHGTGALNIDECRVKSHGEKLVRPSIFRKDNDVLGKGLGAGVQVEPAGRWPSNVVFAHAEQCGPDDTTPCVEGCPVAELDGQSGVLKSGDLRQYSRSNVEGWAGPMPVESRFERRGDSGGASRFFPTFRYQAKAPRSERPRVDGVAHATVKPLALMRWLVRLVTPPGGLVVDPFAGSGTTAEACITEGFDVISIEREAEYLPLIQSRIDRSSSPPVCVGAS